MMNFQSLASAGALLAIMTCPYFQTHAMAQQIVDATALKSSICDPVLPAQVEASLAKFSERRSNLTGDQDEARLDRDVFAFLKQHLAVMDALIGLKKSLRVNILAAGKNIDPASDLQKIIRFNLEVADAEVAQAAQIRSAVLGAASVAAANAELTRAWQQDTGFSLKVLVGKPGEYANGGALSPFIGLSGIGQEQTGRAAFRVNYCYSGWRDAELGKPPLPYDQMHARELLERGPHPTGAWRKLAGHFALDEWPLLSRNVHRFQITESDVGESNFWSKAEIRYDAAAKTITGTEIRRIRPGGYLSRGSSLMSPKPGDKLDARLLEQLRRDILRANASR